MKILTQEAFARVSLILVASILTAFQAPTLPEHCPPVQLHGAIKGPAVFDLSNARAEVTYDTVGRNLRVVYSAPLSEVFTQVIHQTTAYFRTAYWPTDVQVLSPGRWLVSGKGFRSDDAVIEMWEFANDGAVYPPSASGGEWRTPVLQSVTEVYRGASHGLVEKVWDCLAATNTVFVLYYPSHQVFELNLGNSEQKRRVSPVAAGNALVVPELSERWDGFWSGHHTTYGNLYFLKKMDNRTTLVLQDYDSNGTIDQAQMISPAAWIAGEWASSMNYTILK